jgi:hypothetical protein
MNKEKAIEGLKTQTVSFGDLPEILQEDKDVVLSALEMYDISFEDVPSVFHNDRDVTICAVRQSPYVYAQLPEIMKQDKVIAIQAIEQDGDMLEHLPESLQQDRELVTTAVKSRFWAKKYIPEELWSDKKFIDKLFNEIFENDPFLFETKVLPPTEEILMKGFGCNSLDTFVGTTGEDQDSEWFVDLINDNWQISEMSPGESKNVGNEVDICCYHSISGPVTEPVGGSQTLKFFVVSFQVEPIHMVYQQIFDAEGDLYGNDAMFFGSHGVGPISENDYCSEMMGDLENTDDDDWEEEN